MQKTHCFKNRIIREILGEKTVRGWHDWRWQVANRLTRVFSLAALLRLTPGKLARLETIAGKYPFCVTPYYLSLCDPGDRRDPVMRQIMPDCRELRDKNTPPDPLGEKKHSPFPGLIHRYRDRVVVVITADCAVRCRHCTRKNVITGFCHGKIEERLPGIIKYIRHHPQVREVIISGGDPFLLETAVLDRIIGKLTAISSVEVLRIGTRAPVVLPMRIDRELCDCLKSHRPLWINTQFNHLREITPEAEKACRLLQEAGLPVSNQTVLLRGVNDSFSALAALCNGLQRIMVRPYYVFQCDGVRGTRHFNMPVEKAVNLSRRLRSCLGGLSIPLFVVDIPGRKGKVPLEAVEF
ncbi:KamA family radical SAM protein [Verrucomicrobiota bacterium]